MSPAGFFVRLAAYAVDLVIGVTVTGFFAATMWIGIEEGLRANDVYARDPIEFLWWVSCFFVAHILYWFLVPLLTGGRSPGKRLMGLRVMAAGGEPAGARHLLLRATFGHVLAGLPLLFGFLWVGFSPTKQGWHDLVAGTQVVYDRS